MDYGRRTTDEYLATWDTIVENHLFTELAKSLRQLAGTDARAGGPGPEQVAALAYHLAHALRVAASSSGGIHASLEYLQLAAAASAKNVPTS
ncbi:MAG TPA: hypothetical protein VH763_04215 [Gemmatimonadales bacterium]|jgi:hypothetical protein